MDSRERTFLALDHEQPDRAPIDLWASAGFKAALQRERGLAFEAFLDAHDVDLRYVAGPRYVGPPLEEGCDLWGVRRRVVDVPAAHGTEHYSELALSPLADARTAEAILAYDGWPSPDWFDYAPVAASARAIREAGRVAVFMGDRLNRIAQLKPAMYLRGVEQILLDLALNPAIARAVIGRIRAFCLAYAERVLTAAAGLIDIVCTGDDFGSQAGPLVSPAMWEQFLGDGFRAYIDAIHAGGAQVMHHTCGAVRPIIPLMIEGGLDILQSLQPEAAGMDPAALKSAFGERLSFQGGISIQRTLPFGTADDVRAEVRRVIGVMAPGGGYILGTAHNVQADTPVENVEAFLETGQAAGAGP